MAVLQDIVAGALIAVGAFFYVVGAIGIYRMPDLFTRMHAAGISDTVGASLLVAGMMVLAGFSLVTVKLAIIMGVILFSSPIATHALAQAALHEGLQPVGIGNEVLIGPGAHPGPEKIGRPFTRTKHPASKSSTRKSAKSSSATRKTPGPKRRTRS